MNLSNIVEAIIFVSDQPVSVAALKEVLMREQEELLEVKVRDEESGEEEFIDMAGLEGQLEKILDQLVLKYDSPQYPFEIKAVGGGYQFLTKRDTYKFVKQAILQKNKKRLSRAALETLSIIAYRQPITKAEIEFIRGVNCDYAMQKLLERKLVSIVGRADSPGRPLLYATSPFFMQYFGIKDVTELPKLKEFEEMAEDHMELFKQHQVKLAETPKENQSTDGEGSD
ncbi:MAG: SMC-Scp complex subunit ScpB [Bacteroidota bacterium]